MCFALCASCTVLRLGLKLLNVFHVFKGCTFMPTLFDPIQLGDIDLASRIVMAPLTRNRAGAGQVPTELMVQYYAQRANPATGAGLLITEGTPVSPQAHGYLDTPGMQIGRAHV